MQIISGQALTIPRVSQQIFHIFLRENTKTWVTMSLQGEAKMTSVERALALRAGHGTLGQFFIGLLALIFRTLDPR